MLAARRVAEATSDFISSEMTPRVVWLEAFQQYVNLTAPAQALPDGAVKPARFYELLQGFLREQVRARCFGCVCLPWWWR